MKEKVNNLVLFDKVRVVVSSLRKAREEQEKEEEERRKNLEFPSKKRKKKQLPLSKNPLPGHLRQAHPGGPQVQDDHPFDPLRPPPHQREPRARGNPPPRRRGRDQADRRVAPPVHLHEGDQRLKFGVSFVFCLALFCPCDGSAGGGREEEERRREKGCLGGRKRAERNEGKELEVITSQRAREEGEVEETLPLFARARCDLSLSLPSISLASLFTIAPLSFCSPFFLSFLFPKDVI